MYAPALGGKAWEVRSPEGRWVCRLSDSLSMIGEASRCTPGDVWQGRSVWKLLNSIKRTRQG